MFKDELLLLVMVYIFFILVDLPYIAIMYETYQKIIYNIQGYDMDVKTLGFLLCYLFISFQFYYFVVKKKMAIQDAFILGLTSYAIYDFTTYALLDKYPLSIALIDTLWGGVLYSLVFFFMFFVFGN